MVGFSTIKTVWQDAKAEKADEASLDQVGKDALSLLQAYERMNPEQRHTFARAYQLAKKHLEKSVGDYGDWKKDDQVEAARALMNNARKAVDPEPHGAMGIALLSLFLEVNTLRGKEAVRLSADIEHWYAGACENDLHTK